VINLSTKFEGSNATHYEDMWPWWNFAVFWHQKTKSPWAIAWRCC